MGLKVQISAFAEPERDGLPSSGLIVGILSGDVSIILVLAARPARPTGFSTLSWAKTHASQLSWMLPGGVRVLGAFTSSSAPRTVSECSEIAAAVAPGSALVLTAGTGGRLFVRAPGSSKQLEVRPARAPPLHVEATLNLSGIPFASAAGNASPDLLAAEQECLLSACALVARAVLSVSRGPYVLSTDNQVPVADALGWEQPTAKKKVGRKRKSQITPRAVRGALLLPRTETDGEDGEERACASGPVGDNPCPHVVLCGTLVLRALLPQDCTLGNVLAALREDARRSLGARSATLADADQDARENGDAGLWPPPGIGERGIPARVAVRSTSAGGNEVLEFTEYVLVDEEVTEDAVRRVQEMIGSNGAVKSKLKATLLEEIKPAIIRARVATDAVANTVAEEDVREGVGLQVKNSEAKCTPWMLAVRLCTFFAVFLLFTSWMWRSS